MPNLPNYTELLDAMNRLQEELRQSGLDGDLKNLSVPFPVKAAEMLAELAKSKGESRATYARMVLLQHIMSNMPKPAKKKKAATG